MPNEFISFFSFLDSLNRLWMFYSGLVREPLCLFFVRSKDDGEDKVLWGEQAKVDVMGQNEKKVFRINIWKQCRETRAERWRKKLKIWNTISTYEQLWCLFCNRSIWSRSARSATTATQGRWDSGSKSEKNNVFFLQDYSFQIYDYLQVSRGRSNSGPARWVSLVEVNPPTNRLPNHRSTQWRS